MQDVDNNQVANQEKKSEISWREYFYACGRNWYWFALSLILCVSVAFLFAKSRKQTYSSTAYILIKSEENGTAGGNEIFSDLGLGNRQNAVENEIYVIKSTPLMDQVVESLGLQTIYFKKSGLRLENIYKKSPVELMSADGGKMKSGTVELIPLTADSYEFRTRGKYSCDWTEAKYGKKIKTPLGDFTVVKTALFNEEWFNEKITISVADAHRRALALSKSLDVKKADRETYVLALTLQGSNFNMCRDILNTLIAAYNQDAINDKNRTARATEKFIVDRISALYKDLGSIDSQIEQLKVNNNIPDLSSAASTFVSEGSRYNDNVAEVEMQLSLVKYIKDYLSRMGAHELIPSNTGITDNGIEGQITLYNTECLRYNKIAASSGSENPVLVELDKSLTEMRNNIVRSVANSYNTLSLKASKARGQESMANRRIASVPTQEKEISDVVRQQKIKEHLYLYLLNKREENALHLAITEPSAKIIESAGGDDVPISPRTSMILLVGVMLGVMIPAGILYLIFWYYILDTMIHTRKDIEDATDIPIIGELPCKAIGQEDEEIVVSESARDRLSEAFRIVRGNLDYILGASKDGLGSVIQMTSTIPGEGKSYVAINLAITCAQFDKKVIAVDLDLRKGNFSKYLGQGHTSIGVSAYLSGKVNDLDDIIVKNFKTSNLDILPLGALPPNPAQLLMSERFKEMIEMLKKNYDYVILDTVPYSLVADAQIINRVADMTLYVIRDGKVDKRYLNDLDRMVQTEKIKNLTILMTDMQIDKKRYGYSYSYGYGYGYGYGYDAEEKKKKGLKKLF